MSPLPSPDWSPSDRGDTAVSQEDAMGWGPEAKEESSLPVMFDFDSLDFGMEGEWLRAVGLGNSKGDIDPLFGRAVKGWLSCRLCAPPSEGSLRVFLCVAGEPPGER